MALLMAQCACRLQSRDENTHNVIVTVFNGFCALQACAASARAMLSARLLAAAAAGGTTAAADAGAEHVEALGGARQGDQGRGQGEGDLQEAAARRLTPREEKQLLLPLLRLRQACCHPQVHPSYAHTGC